MSFEQPKLPYALDALQPFLNKEQMDYHYNKHQAAYFANLNRLLEGKPEAGRAVEGSDHRRSGGPGVQQLGPGMEPRFLLELHVAHRRRQSQGRRAEGHRSRFWRLRQVQAGLF